MAYTNSDCAQPDVRTIHYAKPVQGRLEELDAVRGLMLVWMTTTHLPTILSTYVNQPLGFFAATEGFIFLSALFIGRICYRAVQREGLWAMSRNVWRRAGRLYCYQLIMLTCAFAIGAPIAARHNVPAVHNLLDFYFSAGRTRAFMDAALMIYRPPLLDILPIYIIFMALTPIAVMLGLRFGWKYPFAGGFLLWLLAQFGTQNIVHTWFTRVFGLQIPLNQMGAFDLWGWQLWWLIGLWLGVRWGKGDLRLENWARRMAVPAAIVAVFFLGLRYAQFAGMIDLGNFGFLLDKWKFGALRIVDFTAVGLLAIRFQSVLKPVAVRPLVMLGQASLPVFCVHLLFVFIALIALGGNPALTGWQAVVAVAASLSALLLTAKLATRSGTKAKEKRLVSLKVQTERAG